MSDALYGLGFLISLWLAGWLWLRAMRRPAERALWLPLALAWSLGIFASVFWGVYELLGGSGQPAWTDILYTLRYPLIAVAVIASETKQSPPGGRAALARLLLETLAALALGGLVVWGLLTTPLLLSSGQNRDYILAGMYYPVLDVGLAWWLLRRWRQTAGVMHFWLLLSALAYAVANWSNYWARGHDPSANLPLALLGWLLADALALIGVWRKK